MAASNRTLLLEALRRLHTLWKRWDLYTRDGVPLAADAQAELLEAKADLIDRVAHSNMRKKADWYARIEAACSPPPAKAAALPVPACVRHEEQPHDCPTWRGLEGNEPERRIIGLFWCHKVGRWAIRIQTRRMQGKRTNYINTDTQGMSWGHLAVAIDHLKCVLLFRGHLGGTHPSAWNAWSFAKEKMDCGDVELDLDNPLHAHLDEWLARMAQKADELFKYPDTTLRDIPRGAKKFIDAAWDLDIY